VIAQVIFTTKSLGARCTDERSFVGVRTNVDLEIVRLGELAFAEAADVLSRAGPSTHSTAAFSTSRPQFKSHAGLCINRRLIITSASARRISDKRGSAVLKLCNTSAPFSMATFPSLIVFLPTEIIKINGGVQCRRYIKIAILDEYLVHDCWK